MLNKVGAMVKKVMYIPLDERPCNYDFVPRISINTDYEVIIPPADLLGKKKEPADINRLWHWIFENINSVQNLILSVDMVTYGGLIPSRLHSNFYECCESSISNIKKIKDMKSNINIYAFNVIMRCPKYSSSDEEPDYYEQFGEFIFKYGFISHKLSLNRASKEEINEFDSIKEKLPHEILHDYKERRKINIEINKKIVNLVSEKIIDFLIIPQDDSAPYGFTAMDQQNLREYIKLKNVSSRIYMYPGSDEVGMTLFARMVNCDKHIHPKVYLRYSSTMGPYIIPLYEDRMLNESLKYQVMAAGGILCSSLSECDTVLFVNSPGEEMQEADIQNDKSMHHDFNKNLTEFIEYIKYVKNTRNVPCMVADVAYANGADLELISQLKNEGLLFKIDSYAGWNTSSNSIGTAICQGFMSYLFGNGMVNKKFLALRYVEDTGYCALVRGNIGREFPYAESNMYMKQVKQQVIGRINKELNDFVKQYLYDNNYGIIINKLELPWDRLFEIKLDLDIYKMN